MNYINAVPRKFSDCTGYLDEKMARYFGGDRVLSEDIVVELLVSTSFGANSILYAVWLGYLMGMWAMLIHFAWCMSFCLMAYFSERIYTHTSIHDFLSCLFGPVTKKLAAICSIVGLLYFTGWEIAIAKSGLEASALSPKVSSPYTWSILVALVVCIALLYTVVGGQHANGFANLIMNKIKLILLVIIAVTVLFTLNNGGQITAVTLIPSFSEAIRNIGVAGLITNVLLNLSWQFVDNSSWQIISLGCETGQYSANRALKRTAIQIFAIYGVETLLGASLRGLSGLDSDNILSGIIYIVGTYGNFLGFCAISLILLSMMSLIDGMSLSVAQTIMVDLDFGKILNRVCPTQSSSSLRTARVVTLLLGALAAWGIQFLLEGLGSSIFDFVYIFTIVQLGLIGPVIFGLTFSPRHIPKVWVSIAVPIAIGFLMNILGGIWGVSWLSDIAGAVTATSSFVICLMLYWIWKRKGGIWAH